MKYFVNNFLPLIFDAIVEAVGIGASSPMVGNLSTFTTLSAIELRYKCLFF